jgi:hypothetical protein
VRRHISISEAQALAPSDVLIPERVPSDWTLHCTYAGPSKRPPAAASVHIHYTSRSAHESLALTETAVSDPQPGLDDAGWDTVSVGGDIMRVRERDENWPQAQLQTQHDRTRVLMTSDSLPSRQLIALAAMLISAPPAAQIDP